MKIFTYFHRDGIKNLLPNEGTHWNERDEQHPGDGMPAAKNCRPTVAILVYAHHAQPPQGTSKNRRLKRETFCEISIQGVFSQV
ncbi:hypothetical protein OW567_03895, partial [Acidithiobacillus ferriphilus]|uniref:hypothetical protein n=1 Tax=Acidithiobacillus ferriphilus TaxID=1689834 RepID=UPI002DBDEB97